MSNATMPMRLNHFPAIKLSRSSGEAFCACGKPCRTPGETPGPAGALLRNVTARSAGLGGRGGTGGGSAAAVGTPAACSAVVGGSSKRVVGSEGCGGSAVARTSGDACAEGTKEANRPTCCSRA